MMATPKHGGEPPAQPSLPFRASSKFTLGLVAAACRGAMFGLQRTEVHGLSKFLEFLDRRRSPETRERGLITVSNHLSIIDDPFMWGALPLRYAYDADNMRWSLGSYDLCFRNAVLSTFFNLGQVLPTHRLKFSVNGGPFQATMTQAIRLLSDPFAASKIADTPSSNSIDSTSLASHTDISDPFTSSALTYTTTGTDAVAAPAAYRSRRHAWIHVFPEGRIHQHPHYIMRYFRWGVARLILEADVCPDVVPIWIEGCDQIMHEERTFPRFLPRFGKHVGIWFGEPVDRKGVFRELRQRWQQLVTRDERRRMAARQSGGSEWLGHDGQRRDRLRKAHNVASKAAAPQEAPGPLPLGELSWDLRFGREAVELRKETALAVRQLVLDLRRRRGLPDEDPKASLVETWIEEGPSAGGWEEALGNSPSERPRQQRPGRESGVPERKRDGSVVREE